jgi:hypothetical protein
MFKNSYLFLILLILGSCGLAATRPKLEMSMAQASFMAAKEVKADEAAPNIFRKAEIYYIKARSAYRRKYFNKAKNYAILCKKFSEEAEFEAVKKQTLDNSGSP